MLTVVLRKVASHTPVSSCPTAFTPSPSMQLHALVFRLDIAERVEPLDEVAAEFRDEMIREIKEREE